MHARSNSKTFLLLSTLVLASSTTAVVGLPVFTPPQDTSMLSTDPSLLKRMQSIDCEALYADDLSSSAAVRRTKVEWCKAAIVKRVAEAEGRKEVEIGVSIGEL